MRTWVFLSASILASTSANLLLRATMSASGTSGALEVLASPAVWGGIALWGLGFLLWLLVLAREEISRVFPVVVGAAFAITVTGSTLLLGEHGTVGTWTGIALVVVGIAICSSGERRAA